ncbi:MAG: hypothetical protein QGI09_09020, partial [Dehalococcoidia bacterium]|nr:hypothetical protein [Dehalococcoidia bacterium]
LASGMMVRLRAERRALLCFCVIMLLIAAVHVLPICFSRYSVFDHLKFYTAPDEYFAKKAWVPAEGRLPAVLTAGARD